MADLSITAANVAPSGADFGTGIAGGTITQGQPVRLNTSNQVVATSDDSAANAAAIGIAVSAASSGQYVTYQKSGSINLGATIAVGKVYVVSTTGGIAPVDDIAGGEFITVLGVGVTASSFKIGICQGGVAAAGAVA